MKKMPAARFLHSLIFILPLFSFAQNICKGVLVDSLTRQPVEFANVGIAGNAFGTVSNEKGEFSFPYPDSLRHSSVRISLIGYKTKKFPIGSVGLQMVQLSPESILLAEIPVSSKKSVTKILGNKTTTESVSAGFKNNTLGTELAIKLHIKHKNTHLKKLMFQINENNIDSLIFRFNVYSENEKGYPGENILKQNIYIRPSVKKGMVEADLLPYSIFTDNDVFVSLEWIKDLGDISKLTFATKMIGSATYFRQASQGKWEKVSPIGVGLHAEVSY